jgi:NADH-quinone oxidoreductase subunit N
MTDCLMLLPEKILTLGLFIFLCLTLAKKSTADKLVYPVAILTSLLTAAAALGTLHLSGLRIHGAYRIDAFSQGFKAVIALAFFFTALLAQRARTGLPDRAAELMIFLTASALGMTMMASANDVLTLYVAMELSSYSLYLLAAVKKKYYLLGAATSGILLWGLSLVVGLAGTTSLAEIARLTPGLLSQPVFSLGLFFAAAAFLFKLSGFPMHFWAPDVYETAETPVVNFIATGSKAAAVAVFLRVFGLTGIPGAFVPALGVIAFFSMTVGNTAALLQKDVKRLLAYSSVAQAGYLLTAILAGTLEGNSSAFFYAFAYVLMNTGAFLVVSEIAKDSGSDNPSASSLDGLAERSPLLALLLLLSLLSLAGIPPLAGFTGKWFLFSAAMEKHHWFLVLWGVLNSVVSLFYYLTLVKHAYLEKASVQTPMQLSGTSKILALALVLAILALGLYPAPVIGFARAAIASSFSI